MKANEKILVAYEASSLGWRPGEWPKQATVRINGRKVWLVMVAPIYDGGEDEADELVAVEYMGLNGQKIHVLND